MKVKICGITNFADAEAACGLGADALGFNFYPPSPRYIDPENARRIIEKLPPFVTTVGVFVNVADPDSLLETARKAGIQVLQLHGDEGVDYCRRLAGRPLIRTLRLGKAPLPDIGRIPARAFLLDTGNERLFGGTGKAFDWSLAETFPRNRPVVLAGGLRPANVAEAIRRVRPYGVDVCSGVESGPGKKDVGKMSAFMKEVENAVRRL